MRYITLLLILFCSSVSAQNTSFIVRGDTVFLINPTSGAETQINRLGPAPATIAALDTKFNKSDTGDAFSALRNAILGRQMAGNYAASSHVHAYNSLTGLPTLFDGNYNSLTNKPSLFNGAYSSLSGIPSTFTPSAHVHAQSDITNLTTDLGNKQATLVSGTNIKTVNGSSILGSGDLTISGGGAVSFANGGNAGVSAAPATTGVMSVPMTSSIITITPTGACTFNASGGVAGQIVTFHITTSGTTSFVMTWGTNFRKTGTLGTGTVSARYYSVTFRCIDGTIWTEIGRTAVQS